MVRATAKSPIVFESQNEAQMRLFRSVSVSVFSFGSDQCSTQTISFLVSLSVFFFRCCRQVKKWSEVNLLLIPKVKKKNHL